jgi:uncharacterized protein YbjT (DUF2867 family)
VSPRHARPELDGWRAIRARSADGAFESDERVRIAGPVVEFSEHGARVLADRYWLEVSRLSRGIVRRRDTSLGLELRLLGRGPCLLRFGPAERTSDVDEVRCRYPIAGGLLTRQPGGELSLSQSGSQPAELRHLVRAGAAALPSGHQQALFQTADRRGVVKVAVLGATGFIGRTLLPELAGEHDAVAVSRSGAGLEDNRVKSVSGDVTDHAAMRRALDGVNVVYYLVHSLGASDFSERDKRAAATVATEAERAGVSQIVYLGGLGDDRSDLSPHLRSRAETAATLKKGAVPVTTLRAAMVVGRGSAGFETIVALVDRLPVMIAPKWVSMPTQPIALTDVIAYLAGVAGHHGAIGDTFDLGGPDVLTYREMIERIAALRGRRRAIVEVPILSPRLSSYWLHLVTPVRAGVARPLVEGLRNPTVVRDDRIRRLLPRALTSFDAAARAALGQM